MYKCIIGIDNGVTGSVAIISDEKRYFYKTPTIKQQSYTKKKQGITRVDGIKLKEIITNHNPSFCLIERPMVNPGRWKASMSAIRCLEATLIILEDLKIPYQYCDSKQWQKVLLPKGLKKEELKKASIDISCRLFPELKDDIIKQKDGDSLLIAEYAKRNL